MRVSSPILTIALLCLAIIGLPLNAGAQSANSESVAEFYEGNTIRMIIRSSPGGGYDTFARLVARHMGKYIPGNPEITLKLRKNPRARRMTLRISRVDGAVTLTVPRGVSDREALAFAAEKQDWVLGHLSQQAATVHVGPGQTLNVGGAQFELVAGAGKRLRVVGNTIELPQPVEKGRLHLLAWLKEQARAELTRASDHYAERLGRGYARLSLRDTRSRWGSCSSAGALMYSWRLILAPKSVLAYVAAHEVAHLQEMNHSADFWRVVDQLYGPHQAARAWLRQDGPKLHRFRFDA